MLKTTYTTKHHMFLHKACLAEAGGLYCAQNSGRCVTMGQPCLHPGSLETRDSSNLSKKTDFFTLTPTCSSVNIPLGAGSLVSITHQQINK